MQSRAHACRRKGLIVLVTTTADFLGSRALSSESGLDEIGYSCLLLLLPGTHSAALDGSRSGKVLRR